MSILLPGAEPILHLQTDATRGSVGVICLHGFTANPSEVRWMAAALHDGGKRTVIAPRLTGHGTSPEDLARTRWRDWLASAMDACHLLQSAGCSRLFAVGHSMGGLLALQLAMEGFPLAGVVALATPIHYRTRRQVAAARVLYPILPYTAQPDRSPLADLILAEQARRDEPVIGRVRYERWPTRAIGQLHALTMNTRARLAAGQMQLPLLLVYSRADITASPESGEIIHHMAATQDKTLRILEHSGHIIPQDVERETAFGWIDEWLTTHRG